MKANKTYQVQQHGRKTEYKTKKAALKLADELAIYNESDNVSVYEYNHNTGIYTEIYTREYNTDNTPATMNEAKELSNAGYCLDVYLMNDQFIYKNCTQKAIEAIANEGLKINSPEVVEHIKRAVRQAASEVHLHDGLAVTPEDIKAVLPSYCAYIIECAKYEVANA